MCRKRWNRVVQRMTVKRKEGEGTRWRRAKWRKVELRLWRKNGGDKWEKWQREGGEERTLGMLNHATSKTKFQPSAEFSGSFVSNLYELSQNVPQQKLCSNPPGTLYVKDIRIEERNEQVGCVAKNIVWIVKNFSGNWLKLLKKIVEARPRSGGEKDRLKSTEIVIMVHGIGRLGW